MQSGDPRCSVCGDAYGTRFVCAPCRLDPANARWSEAPKGEVLYERLPEAGGRMPWGEGEDHGVTPMFRAVVLLLITERDLSLRALARLAGCTEGYIRKVINSCKSLRKPS